MVDDGVGRLPQECRGGCSRRRFVGTVAAGGIAAMGLGLSGLLSVGSDVGLSAYAQQASPGTKTEVRSETASRPEAAAGERSERGTREAVAAGVPVTSSEALRNLQPYASPLVVEQADFEANPKRVLVVVDYQVDFVDGGAFGRIEPAVAIEGALCAKVQEYLDADDIVIYTMDTHPADAYDLTREGAFNPPHCIPGTEGWQIYGRARQLLTPDNAIRVLKGTYGSPDLPFVIQMLRNQGVRVSSIEMAGVSTTCRVLHNVILLYTYLPDLPIVFDSRTTAGYTDERTAEQLDELEGWGFIVKRA